jgi:hypothetical protein
MPHMKKELVFAFFIECSTITNDPFWKSVFEDLAYGKCPYGCYISKNYLCCGFKGKEFYYKLDTSKSTDTIYREVYSLLHDKMGLVSNNERQDILQKIEAKSGNLNLKRKNVRELLLENYIIKNKINWQLSETDTKRLHRVILTGLVFKTITSKNIVYENGEIVKIHGIDFQKGGFTLTIPMINQKNRYQNG